MASGNNSLIWAQQITNRIGSERLHRSSNSVSWVDEYGTGSDSNGCHAGYTQPSMREDRDITVINQGPVMDRRQTYIQCQASAPRNIRTGNGSHRAPGLVFVDPRCQTPLT